MVILDKAVIASNLTIEDIQSLNATKGIVFEINDGKIIAVHVE